MANEQVTNEFDKLLADLLENTPDVAVSDIGDVGDEPEVVSPPVLRMETIGDTVTYVPSQPVQVQQAEKPTYRTDPGKKPVDGAPFESTVYSRGYVSAKWPGGRFANKCAWYLEELEALESWFGTPQYQTWKSAAIEAGLKHRRQG